MRRGVSVVIERRDGEILEVSLEVLGEMRRVAGKTCENVAAVMMGKVGAEEAALLASHGAEKIYAAPGEIFEPYRGEVYAKQLARLIEELRPRLVAAGSTSSSREYFPKVAAMAGAAMVANCARVKIGEGGGLVLSKTVYGGKAYADVTAGEGAVIMATIKPGAFSKGVPVDSRAAEVIEAPPAPMPDRLAVTRLGHVDADPATVDVSEAEVIVAGGRGMGSKEGFELLEELAGLIGASLGGSRPAVDNQWVDYDRQIGQSGKTVEPEVYVGCGISGDSYHLMGMKDSKLIVAINKDAKAPLMKSADVGAVADLGEIIPEMIGLLRKRPEKDGAGHD